MWRFWRWPRPPMDKFTAMALLVRAVEKENPNWREIKIVHTADGVSFGHN